MKKAIFIALFLLLYLFSFSQDNTYNPNKSLFVVVSPIGLTDVSNIKFSDITKTQYDKKYDVSSTALILYLSGQKDFNYNITLPSDIVVNNVRKSKIIVINLKSKILGGDRILDSGKEMIKVIGVFIMTPTTASGIYQNVFEIKVNFQ